MTHEERKTINGIIDKDRKAIINDFLAENDLRHASGAEIGSLDDLEAAESKSDLMRDRWESVYGVLREYINKTSVDVMSAYSQRSIQMLNWGEFGKYEVLSDFSEEDFDLFLRYIRAVFEGLAQAFPRERRKK